MSWTNQQKIFSLETYFATKSYQSVQIQFRKCFHCRNFPPKSTIVSWVTKFREHGTVVDLCSKATGGTYSGRKKSARTEENIAAMCLKMTKTFLRTSGSQMKPIFCFLGTSIAKTMFLGFRGSRRSASEAASFR